MSINNKLYLLGSGLYLIIAITTSAPFFIKHFRNYFIVCFLAYSILLIVMVYTIQRFNIEQFGIINNHPAWILLVLMLAVSNVVLYPKTRLVPNTAPDALMEPAIALIRIHDNPYSIRLFDGAPVSPGPGWILLNSVFSLSGLITLLTPIYLLWAGSMIAKWNKTHAFIFTLLLLLTINFLQLSFTGHDLAATSLAMIALTLMLFRYHKNNFLFYVIAILTGLVATARVPFIVFPIVLSACLNTINRRQAIQFALFSTGLTVIIHLVFYFWALHEGIFYQPLHVFARASHGSSSALLGFGTLTWIASGLYMWRHLKKEPSMWLIFLWIIIAIPFIFVGLGELFSAGLFSLSAWANWEGKGYVMFSLPLLLAALALYRPRV